MSNSDLRYTFDEQKKEKDNNNGFVSFEFKKINYGMHNSVAGDGLNATDLR